MMCSTAGGYGVEAITFDCETPRHSIQASFRNHQNRGIYGGDRLIRKCRCDAHNVP